jgi:hypothetical protein
LNKKTDKTGEKMRRFLIAAVAAGLPLSNAFAQLTPAFAPPEPSWAVFFFASVADDRTTRPSSPNLSPSCWSNKTTAGLGALVEYKTPVSVVLGTGLHYLGTHKNGDNCGSVMELSTFVAPFTVGYAIPLGSRVHLTPKIGVSYMWVGGEFGTRTASDSSVKPTFGVSLEGSLNRRWALRGSFDRYTGKTNLFGLGEFKQEFNVLSLGGVFRW